MQVVGELARGVDVVGWEVVAPSIEGGAWRVRVTTPELRGWSSLSSARSRPEHFPKVDVPFRRARETRETTTRTPGLRCFEPMRACAAVEDACAACACALDRTSWDAVLRFAAAATTADDSAKAAIPRACAQLDAAEAALRQGHLRGPPRRERGAFFERETEKRRAKPARVTFRGARRDRREAVAEFSLALRCGADLGLASARRATALWAARAAQRDQLSARCASPPRAQRPLLD